METISGPGILSESVLPIQRNADGVKIRNLANGRWLVLTPEETVRQGLIWMMVHRMDYPKSMISTERSVRVERMLKRFDVVVMNREGQPFLLAECKAPAVSLGGAAEQAARYNSILKAPYLLITNGLEAACYHTGSQGYARLEDTWPEYPR